MDLYILVYLLSNVFLAHIINKFMYLFYEKCRVNKYIEFCVYSAYFILITFIFLFFEIPIMIITFNIVSIFLFTLIYDYINFKKSIVVTFIIYLILFLIELSVISLTNFNQLVLHEPYKYRDIVGFIVMYVIIYIILYCFTYVKKSDFKKLELVFSSKYFLLFLSIPLISIFVIIVTFIYARYIYLIILVNASILFLNIIIFKYCDLILNNLYEKVFDKFLKDKINTYKKEIQNFERKIQIKRYINSNNDFIDGILNSKISSLDNENDIKLKFDILIEKNLNVSSNDLLIIIGNLMDNAISGVRSTLKNKDKYIDLKIKYLKGTIIINIKNSFNENTLIKNRGLFNKKGKFEGYGLGLLSVKDVVEKYNGVLDIKFNKNNFETYILMYDIKV